LFHGYNFQVFELVIAYEAAKSLLFLQHRMKTLVEYFKISLDCFFAVWFVVGNVWIFGGHSSADDAPNMYRYSL